MARCCRAELKMYSCQNGWSFTGFLAWKRRFTLHLFSLSSSTTSNCTCTPIWQDFHMRIFINLCSRFPHGLLRGQNRSREINDCRLGLGLASIVNLHILVGGRLKLEKNRTLHKRYFWPNDPWVTSFPHRLTKGHWPNQPILFVLFSCSTPL